MWIKICANTNLNDAQMAAELGADAVGFVFAPSKRQVTAAQVAQITPHLPDLVERVGVFHSHDVEDIAATVRDAGLNAVQLHGGVSPALAQQLSDLFAGSIKIIQTLHWVVDADGRDSALFVQDHLRLINAAEAVDRVLIDSKVGNSIGGTGVPFNWDSARTAFARGPSRTKLIVAGGLRPDNVAEAIRELSPWGVDVASGVESEPGRKDPEKLAAFIKNARAAINAG